MDAIIVTGASAKEIAALVVEIQGRHGLTVVSEDDIRALARATYDRRQGSQAKPDN